MKLTFIPQNVEVEIDGSKSVLEIAKENSIHIKSVCGGTPACAECRVQVAQGEYNLLPPSEKELSLIGTAYFVDQSRLSCQMRCFGDVTIDLNEQIAKQAQGTTTKKPRGRAQKAEGEESFAVEGSILLGGADLEIFGDPNAVGIDRTNERRAVEVFDQDETRRALEQIRRQRAAAQVKIDADEDEYLKKLNKRNRKFQEYGTSDEGDQDVDLSKIEDKPSSDSSNKNDSRNNKSRNNRNNKNRNKPRNGPQGNSNNRNANQANSPQAAGSESNQNRTPRPANNNDNKRDGNRQNQAQRSNNKRSGQKPPK